MAEPSLDNLTNYSRIFSKKYHAHNPSNPSNTILYLKKQEWDIYYSTKYKYPILVAETINGMTGKTDPNEAPIDRREIIDPFRLDLDIPEKYQYSMADYEAYKEYGGSYGHNAPAGQHKTNMQIWNDTFQFSNITPQEIMFNSGLWALMENWCKNLARNQNHMKIMVFTGSIPSNKDKNFNGVIMNVPDKMFKIVCIQLANRPNLTAMDIFITRNQPYTVNYNQGRFNLAQFLLPHNNAALKTFQQESGVNIHVLLEYYGFNASRIRPFREHLNMEILLNPNLVLLMKKSKWFGKLIYSKTLDILEYNWAECQSKSGIPVNEIDFHREYYELSKKRIMRDNKMISVSTIPDYSKSQSQLINKTKKTSSKKHHSRKKNKKTKSKSH
jgi:DNA/RNA endonuclease G (NUC1)